MKVTYNTKNWPYFRLTFENQTATDNDFQEHLNNFENLYEICKGKNEKMIIIFDLRNIPSNSFKYVKQQVAFNKKIKPLSRKYLEHSLFLTNKFGKYILNLVFTIEAPVCPYHIFDKENDLIKFIKAYNNKKIAED